MMTASVTLFGRAGCCLCDEARTVMERVRLRVPFHLEEQDIESDERLLRRYLERIPVVTIDGRETFELFVDEAAFELAVQRSQAGGSPR